MLNLASLPLYQSPKDKALKSHLTKQEIIEVSGENDLEALKQLEILFNGFQEIGGLEECTTLQKMSLIDNGLQRITNLRSVALTLTSLCLCDQDITKMENLLLPNLKTLYLHRNHIEKMEGLDGCPRLKKLWLFQNNISKIEGLHAVPELKECWLQSNRIESCKGTFDIVFCI